MSDRDPMTKTRSARLWRVLGALSLAGAMASLAAGVAFAYFSATGSATGTATVGHLHLLKVTTGPATVTYTCTVTDMTPGESSTGWTGSPAGTKSDNPCAFTVTLTTTGRAYLGLSTTIGGTGLYAPGGLRFQITDTTTSSYTASGTINTNTATDPLYVGTFSSSGNHTFTVNFSLPVTVATATFQGKTTTVTLTVHAVVSGQHATTTGLTGGPPCTPGVQCAGLTRWS
jgi:predicted ribosomally synthesized peptide with SipW-like signal peptide